MIKVKNFFNIKWLIIAVIFTATVVFLSHLPAKQSNSGLLNKVPSALAVSRSGAVEHILAYGVITFLFILSLRTWPSLLSALLLFFAILLVGAIDELTQPFVSRTASLADWLANIIGVSGVLLFFLRFKRPGHQSNLTTQHPTPET